jgi:DNA gyrase subunit B
MDVNQRAIAKVKLDDAEKAAEMFNILMSDKVEPRKNFIIRYAKEATNVDWHC